MFIIHTFLTYIQLSVLKQGEKKPTTKITEENLIYVFTRRELKILQCTWFQTVSTCYDEKYVGNHLHVESEPVEKREICVGKLLQRLRVV